MSINKTPEWAKENIVDKDGNVYCKVCNGQQSPSFTKCIFCCQHNTLHFEDDWIGNDEVGGWGLECICSECGKNFDFDTDTLKNNYKVVRIPAGDILEVAGQTQADSSGRTMD